MASHGSRKRARHASRFNDAASAAHLEVVAAALADGPSAWGELQAIYTACSATVAAMTLRDGTVDTRGTRARFAARAEIARRTIAALHRLTMWAALSAPRASDDTEFATTVRDTITATIYEASEDLGEPSEHAVQYYITCATLASRAYKYKKLTAVAGASTGVAAVRASSPVSSSPRTVCSGDSPAEDAAVAPDGAPDATDTPFDAASVSQYYRIALAQHRRALEVQEYVWYVNLCMSLMRVLASVFLHVDLVTSPEAAAAATAAVLGAMTA